MELLTLAAVRTHDVRTRRATSLAVMPEAYSALPGAPVVAEPERAPRAPRVRTALATSLHRLADGVAPHRPAGYATGC